jgi:hypothetical protein
MQPDAAACLCIGYYMTHVVFYKSNPFVHLCVREHGDRRKRRMVGGRKRKEKIYGKIPPKNGFHVDRSQYGTGVQREKKNKKT